jgi:hypothetical protein
MDVSRIRAHRSRAAYRQASARARSGLAEQARIAEDRGGQLRSILVNLARRLGTVERVVAALQLRVAAGGVC